MVAITARSKIVPLSIYCCDSGNMRKVGFLYLRECMKEKKYFRNCPTCGEEIGYYLKGDYNRATRECWNCVRCGHKLRGEKLRIIGPFIRNCPNPECNAVLTYTRKSKLDQSIREHRLCRKCVFSGERNHQYGLVRSSERKAYLSELNSGANNPQYGIPMSEERKRKISDTNKITCNKPEIRHQRRLTSISRIEKSLNNGGQLSPAYNLDSIPLLEQINASLGWGGRHAENGGEYHIKELGYWVDFYEPNLNIVIEYDEPHHFDTDGKLRVKDIARQDEISKHLNCKFYRILEGTPIEEILADLTVKFPPK